MSRVVAAARAALRARGEIVELLEDALGAASLLGLIFVLGWLGEMFR